MPCASSSCAPAAFSAPDGLSRGRARRHRLPDHGGRQPTQPPAQLLARLFPLVLLVLLCAGACSQQREAATVAAPLSTGHFEGLVELPRGPAASFRLALELRQPRAGRYEAEVLAPDQPSLNFVADTVDFQQETLRLTRPGRPGQRLRLTREGNFWRGTLTLDSAQVPVLLVRRGDPAPATYRVRRLAAGAGLGTGALLFAPADEATPGPALALLPAAAHTNLAPQWADVLARAGVIVLLLPAPADTTATELPLTQAAGRWLRATPGADTARLGLWATAGRAGRLLPALSSPTGPTGPTIGPPAFVVVQRLIGVRELRPALRKLTATGAVLGLEEQGQPSARRNSAALRAALGQRGQTQVRVVPAAAAGTAVAEWLGMGGQ